MLQQSVDVSQNDVHSDLFLFLRPEAPGYIRFSYAEDRNKHIIPGMKHILKVIIELIEKSGEVPPLKKEEVDEKIKELEQKYFA